MRLVDDETRDLEPPQGIEEAARGDPLGRQVEEAELAGARPRQGVGALGGAHLAVQAGRGTPSWLRRATWSTISAISGETTIVSPPPTIPGTQ